MTNEIVIEEHGLITLETESRKVKVENSLTPRGKLEMLWKIFTDGGTSWNAASQTIIDEGLGNIIEDNVEDYEYGLDVNTNTSLYNIFFGLAVNQEIQNSEVNIDKKIYDTQWRDINLNDETLENDIYKAELFMNIKSDEFEQPEDESKEFDLIFVGDSYGDIAALYAFLDDTFTIEPYEQLDFTWEIELKLPDVPE